jgi:hypothetical protein
VDLEEAAAAGGGSLGGSETMDMDIQVELPTPRPGKAAEVDAEGFTAADRAAAQLGTYVTQEAANKAARAAQKALAAKSCDTGVWGQTLTAAGARVWDCALGQLPAPSDACATPGADGSEAPTSAYQPAVSAAVVEAMGTRDAWEDRSVVAPQLPLPAGCPPLPPVSLLATFDGHRGAAAADYCARALPGLVAGLLGEAAAASSPAAPSGGVLAGIMRTALLKLEQGERRWAVASVVVGVLQRQARPFSRVYICICTYDR